MENYPGKLFASCMLTADETTATPKFAGDGIYSVTCDTIKKEYIVTLQDTIDPAKTSLAATNVDPDIAQIGCPRCFWIAPDANNRCRVFVSLVKLDGTIASTFGRWSLQVYRTEFGA